MDVPESMRAELGRGNNSDGIDLESWIGFEGSFALAIGYATIFWPEFESVNGYILRKGASPENVRDFAQQPGATQQSVEWVMNHIHLLDLHTGPVDDASSDKLIALGNVLADIYRAKLAWQFPDKPCEVEFFVPEDREELWEYQLSFWQTDGDTMDA